MNTDAYHDFLITGGPALLDLPSTSSEALDEWEGNLLSVCEESGIKYNPRMTLNELILAWMRANVGESLLISEIRWSAKTTVISVNGMIPYMNGLNNLSLETIGKQSTRHGRAPVISIVYGQDTPSN